jgi:hypothetical protein
MLNGDDLSLQVSDLSRRRYTAGIPAVLKSIHQILEDAEAAVKQAKVTFM